MHAYLKLLFGLLIPLASLFIVAAVLYFRIEYDFTKAMRLGVLFGFFIAIAVSPFTALFLLIMRRGKQPKSDIFEGIKHRKKKQRTVDVSENDYSSENISSPSASQKVMMLLMDKSIAFEVLLYAIAEHHLGILTESEETEGHLTLKTQEGMINMLIHPLTKHTSQITLNAQTDTQYLEKIVHYMKKKEYAFTQY